MVSFAFKNYYERLGVTKQASDVEIRKAFRQLAQIYHPDIAGNKEDAQEIFVLINEAHQALIDPSMRQEYDRGLTNRWTGYDRAAPPSSGEASEMDDIGIRNVEWERSDSSAFARKAMAFRWKTAGGRNSGLGRRDLDMQAYVEVSLEEAISGASMKVCIDFDEAAGSSQTPCTYRLNLPEGVWRGEQFRMVGCGLRDDSSGEFGDLYLRIGYTKHDRFRLMGTHVYTEIEIMPWEAALGATVEVSTLGDKQSLVLPEGVQPAQRFNIKDSGMPERFGGRGDLIVSVRIRFPSAISTRQKALWEVLAREYRNA